MKSARKRAKAIARGRDNRLVIPLAFDMAAQISARPLDEFHRDPTQLTNGLSELQKAIAADGIVCALGAEMELLSSSNNELNFDGIRASGPVNASLEACTRLRQIYGEEVALFAGLTGPNLLCQQFGATEIDCANFFNQMVTTYCESGIDVLMVMESDNFIENLTWKESLTTARNIASFHQAFLISWNEGFLPTPSKKSVLQPSSDGMGVITTDRVLPHDYDISILRQFVTGCRGVS